MPRLLSPENVSSANRRAKNAMPKTASCFAPIPVVEWVFSQCTSSFLRIFESGPEEMVPASGAQSGFAFGVRPIHGVFSLHSFKNAFSIVRHGSMIYVVVADQF